MHHTGKKESKKEILKTEEKNNVTKNLLQGDSNMDPQNQLEQTGHASVNLRSSVVVVAFFLFLLFCFFGSIGKKAYYRDKGRGHDRRLRLCPLDHLGKL